MRVIDLHVIDVVADGMTDHFGGGEGQKQLFERESGVVGEPEVIRFGADDHGHAVVNRSQELVGPRGDDRAGSDPAFFAFPTVPDTREGERRLVFHLKIVRLRDLSVPLPLIETVCWDEAASPLKRLVERCLLFDRFSARVDEAFRLFAPEGNQAPAEKCGFSFGVTLENRQNILTRRDVVARNQIVRVVSIESLEFYSLWCLESKSAAHN